ncbi:TerD family protein [Actinocorallia aurea]
MVAELVLRRRRRVLLPDGPAGDGRTAARQVDAVLMSAGFKLSAALLERLGGLAEGAVIDLGGEILDVVRREVGDHVAHNAYFRDFPAGVPDTLEFWADCVLDALGARGVEEILAEGGVDLLRLPKYGRYQHTYAEMAAAHAEFLPSEGDRVTVLHLGGEPREEARELYFALAGGTVPLHEDDLRDLSFLAVHCANGPQPERIPVRENRAVVNRARLAEGLPLLADTVTDVLRLACALSEGDVTLQTPTRFRSLSRGRRRALLAALDAIVRDAPGKLGDVHAHREAWKRLGERLHPHEFAQWPHAQDVFAVARGDKRAPSLASRVEAAFAADDVPGALAVLTTAPGMLFRAVDRLLRVAVPADAVDAVLAAVAEAAPRVSGRVLLGVREHLMNRADAPEQRVFVNRTGGAHAQADDRAPIPDEVIARLTAVVDDAVRGRLPISGPVLVDPDILDVALPLSGKAAPTGFGVLPRGSESKVDAGVLRFFTYWRQNQRTTDFDLSALFYDAAWENGSWVSYTNLEERGAVHSGDVVDAPDGASEFIDIDLSAVEAARIVPQVHVFAGEGYTEVAESFFGFMLRESAQEGLPFEPATVRMKSELRGAGGVALPLVFSRSDDGTWRAKWMHLHLRGMPSANAVENTRVSAALLAATIADRAYVTVRHLLSLLPDGSVTVADGTAPAAPVTYIGLEAPEDLPPGSTTYLLDRLPELIPA